MRRERYVTVALGNQLRSVYLRHVHGEVWMFERWRFRRERTETGHPRGAWRWWARDGRPGGKHDFFPTLHEAVQFALLEDQREAAARRMPHGAGPQVSPVS